MAEVELREIYKNFASKEVIQGVNLTCPDHKYLCLLGPSGCGKTTLLRMVAGLESPDRGDVLLGGERVTDHSPSSRNVGMAFQNYALYPHLSVFENLAFPFRAPIRRKHYSREEIARLVASVAELLHIEPLLERPINALSGGQMQRVALGRALVRTPVCLLLDEPISHLDARLRYEMRGELKTLQQKLQTTTIHVTHDQSEALAVADLLAIMVEGGIEQIGPPMEVYRNPATAMVAGFIGNPPMSLLSANLIDVGGELRLVVANRELAPPECLQPALRASNAANLRLGLRTRHVGLVETDAPDAIPAIVYSYGVVDRETELLLSIGEDIVRCRTQRGPVFHTGEHIFVRLDLDGALAFDARTGINLAISNSRPLA